MSKIEYEKLLNPEGSITNQFSVGHRVSDREFQYSANNPAMDLVESMAASGKFNSDDLADLYDKAYQWEIDNHNWMMQLKVDEAIKHEQREYDSPEAQVRRMREAGINPDIAGQSGLGSGSAGGSSAGATKPDNSSSKSWTDNYAGRNYTLQCLNTASAMMTQFTQVGKDVVDMVEQIKLMEPKMEMAEAEAYVAQNTKDLLVKQEAARLEGQQLTNQGISLRNEGQQISNSNALVSQARNNIGYYGDIAQYTNPEFTDDDYTNLFDMFSIPEEQRDMLKKNIKTFNSNPKMQAEYADAKKRFNQTAAYNRVYSQDLLTTLARNQQRLEWRKMDLEDDRVTMQKNFVDYLNSMGYGTQSAEVLLGDTTNQQKSQQILKQQLEQDIVAFSNKLESNAKMSADLKAKAAEIRKEDNGEYSKGVAEALDILAMYMDNASSEELAQAQMMYSNGVKNYYKLSQGRVVDGNYYTEIGQGDGFALFEDAYSVTVKDYSKGNKPSGKISDSLLNIVKSLFK